MLREYNDVTYKCANREYDVTFKCANREYDATGLKGCAIAFAAASARPGAVRSCTTRSEG